MGGAGTGGFSAGAGGGEAGGAGWSGGERRGWGGREGKSEGWHRGTRGDRRAGWSNGGGGHATWDQQLQVVADVKGGIAVFDFNVGLDPLFSPHYFSCNQYNPMKDIRLQY